MSNFKKLGKINSKVNDILLFELNKSYKSNNSPKDFIDSLSYGKYDYLFSKENIKFHPDNIELIEFIQIDERCNCAISLYENLKDLELQEANDKRLWVYLSLYVYRTYTLRRLMKSRGKDAWTKYKQETIINNLFFEGSSAVPNYRNYLSSLWWSIKMTIDESLEDPYKYSKMMFINTEIFMDITQRKNIFKNPILIKAILEVIFEEGNNKLSTTNKSKIIAKTITNNHLISFSLNGLNKDNIKDLINDTFDLYRSK
jgi:hypothetical protein